MLLCNVAKYWTKFFWALQTGANWTNWRDGILGSHVQNYWVLGIHPEESWFSVLFLWHFLEAESSQAWHWWFSMFSASLQTEALRLSETGRCNLCIFSERSSHFFQPGSITAPSAGFPNVEFCPFCSSKIPHLTVLHGKNVISRASQSWLLNQKI